MIYKFIQYTVLFLIISYFFAISLVFALNKMYTNLVFLCISCFWYRNIFSKKDGNCIAMKLTCLLYDLQADLVLFTGMLIPLLVVSKWCNLYTVDFIMLGKIVKFFFFISGDFGNENVELVRSISNLKLPKAMILGNHDSWTTQTFSEK